MTKEEAITKLKSKRDEVCNDCLHAVGWCETHCGFSEAINIAIEALRHPASSNTIDRQEAMAALQKCRKHCIYTFDSYHIDIQEAEDKLMKLPSAQAKPRVGHWIKDNTDDCPPVFRMFRICSECGCVKTEETNYCPNCGVYMEVDKNGTNR